MYDYMKALHIISVVTWFAGLFYIVRLFIYHTEAQEKPEPEKGILSAQFKIMERRLWYGITWPSAILTLVFGTSMLHNFLPLSDNPWLIIKLSFVVLLCFYHLSCGKIFNQLKNDVFPKTGKQLRIFNEIATLFLVTIVFLVVLKDTVDMAKGLVALVLFALTLMLGIKIYGKVRKD